MLAIKNIRCNAKVEIDIRNTFAAIYVRTQLISYAI